MTAILAPIVASQVLKRAGGLTVHDPVPETTALTYAQPPPPQETNTMREQTIRATYYLESEIELEQAAAAMAGEQSSGTFVAVPGESPELHERHGAQVIEVRTVGDCEPSLPSRTPRPRSTPAS